MKLSIACIILLSLIVTSHAQDYRWQQRVEYTMNVSLDVNSHIINGTQRLIYYNNSPDTLQKVYYHLYFNAFQPGSMMDVRSRNLPDPDRRVLDRISKLKDDEIGYQHIQSLKQEGVNLSYSISGTVMEVILAKPILPKGKAVFDLQFVGQVPLQIRRLGRDNREGIAYSMTQWYPKMAEYDYQGWHAYPYVAREFHGVWGDFDVTLTLDSTYTIGGTGILQNPEEVGHGYSTREVKVQPKGKSPIKTSALISKPKTNLVSWHFVAKSVIDFAWAADPDYTHDIQQVPNGPELHFFYQKNEKTTETWKKMQPYAVKTFQYLNEHFGRYPFPTYSIIQGGDGGMEYPMCTLILGEGQFRGVNGTMMHEVAHSWYQMTLASNESLYPWMDEGFTDFASSEAEAAIFEESDPHKSSYQAYFNLVASGLQEPASQHSDHYNTNRAYGTIAYSMGAVFLNQLKYLIGDENFYKGMKLYYNTWKMRHPEPNDFIRIMEKVSGLQLHWYLRYWINTAKKIDYGVNAVTSTTNGTIITLQRLGDFPMPIDLLISYKDGSKESYYMALNEMLGNKPVEIKTIPRIELEPWPWVNPFYSFQINKPVSEVESIEIDPSQRMADVNRRNNKFDSRELTPYKENTK
jgi:hypothetical protein